MKWIFALILVSSLNAICKNETYDCHKESPRCLKPEKTDFGCVPDLFKRYDQIYSIHTEFLLWSVATSSLDYALKMRHDAWGPTPSFAQGRFENATYGIDPGFRIGFLFFRAPHYWELKWQYTRMTNRGSSRSSKPNPTEQFLTGTWPQITDQPLSAAKSHIHFNYNVFDWFADRVFFPNPHLRLRFIGGGVLTWMDQDWKVLYTDSIPTTTTIRNRWKYIGGGLKAGTTVDWFWTRNLYMVASGFFGILIGNYSNHSKQTTTFQLTVNDNTNIPVRDTSYSDNRPAAVIQMLVGPSLQNSYKRVRIEFFTGFEMTSWFNLQEVYRSTSGSPSEAKETRINSSMLSLYGLTTRLSVDF